MEKASTLLLDDRQIIELVRILIDNNEQNALSFLQANFKGQSRQRLEGG